MNIMRSTSGINKVAGAGTAHEQISSTDAVQRASPTTVSSYLECGGRICQEILCDRSSVTFEAMRGRRRDDARPVALGWRASVR